MVKCMEKVLLRMQMEQHTLVILKMAKNQARELLFVGSMDLNMLAIF